MIFISFIENAFKHCNKKDKIPAITIQIKSKKQDLELCVENYFSENKTKEKTTGGFGLKNIKERLELIYKDNYKLDISDVGEIFKVNLKLKRKNGKTGNKN